MLRPSSRMIVLIALAGFVLFTAAACAQSPTTPPGAPSAASPTKEAEPAAETKAEPEAEAEKVADPNAPEKEYSVMLVNGTRVKVAVYPSQGIEGKTIRFDPFVPKTDMNVYALALNSMWQIYGRQAGNFRAQDAVATQRDIVGGTVVLYKVTPSGKFVFFPLIDPEQKQMSAAMVWME